ncbi:hypothetical protein ABFS82_14G313200 [Erythranthe guttata]|uniref:Small ribosomal subunit protein bS18c n=1 Tax=Erythranthe guttata TaxID=4155 RepID=A0A022Q5F9_ERYGU|nr:PREDICTED: uncharacterized protein LOC105973013 [Erythranthe guttata]EYU23902.1 hypothetical protein MIMGU_mgv1a011981mg [Erythranthe guttata]|eukprot:XP_012853458.1 PREDICTED: uncharacterized protein LOC105973013 [Erythranthe guttata]
MKLIRSALRYANAALPRQFQSPHVIRAFSASAFAVTDDKHNFNSSESVDEFEQRIFRDESLPSSRFFRKLDRVEKAHDRSGMGISFKKSDIMDSLGDTDNSLNDGMDYKLRKAATYFEFDPEEVTREDYVFRSDINFQAGMTYDPKDLDLRKPGVRKPVKRGEFETTTDEVLLKADFRNVKFLANFITEAGIIIKRSKTGISAKAQRKIAREIKTARAFGLMPFTTMGTKQFKYGTTMEDEDCDFEYESYDRSFVDEDRGDSMAA